VFVKAEVVSWFSHTGNVSFAVVSYVWNNRKCCCCRYDSVFLIKKFNIKTIYGEPIKISPKTFNKGQIYGGLIFGFGWAITGACPGPLFAQIGTGATVIAVTLLSAIAGTWVYGYLREKLPH
jgi:YeeE/YedE family (DUF395).